MVVSSDSVGILSALDREIAALFDEKEPSKLEDLGGIAFLQGREETLARAALMPEVLALALAELPSDATAIAGFAIACASASVGDDGVAPASYRDAINNLAGVALTASLAGDMQEILSSRAADQTDNEVARWVALGAALQIAVEHPDTRYELLRVLVRLREDDHHVNLLRRAAKVAGVANAHWPDNALVRTLDRLASNPCARDEACFELGMHHLRVGIESSAAHEAGSSFDEAIASFGAAASAREYRPDAEAYRGALLMLTGFSRGEKPNALRERAADVAKALTIKGLWGGGERTWDWLGAEWIELTRWQALAGCLSNAADTLTRSGTLLDDPAPALRRGLLEAYVANRAILGRQPGGVDTYIQPAIDRRMLHVELEREAIVRWLSDESEIADNAPWRDAAALMLRNFRRGADPPPGNS